MSHPILLSVAVQLPESAASRKLIEGGGDLGEIIGQARKEHAWLRAPEAVDQENRPGKWRLEQAGYADWWKDAADNDRVRMVGVLQLILDTASGLEDEEDED